jgi:hypothetical protein
MGSDPTKLSSSMGDDEPDVRLDLAYTRPKKRSDGDVMQGRRCIRDE